MFHFCQEMPMARSAADQRPLFDGWLPWDDLPEPVRQQALDVLAALFLETIELSPKELNSDDAHNH
jgi:hypothetical protein